jgi:N-methylhydantoinase B/oxoprolinase/acetone carboxylase alpha subunit
MERGLLGRAGGADAVVVEVLVVAEAEQDEVVELCRAAALDRGEVVCFEFAGGGAAGVLAVGGALVQCALLRVGGAASDA